MRTRIGLDRRVLAPVLLASICGLSWPSSGVSGEHPFPGPPGPVSTQRPSNEPVGPDRAEAWIQDLLTLRRELVERHADVYHTVSPAELDASVETLRETIPRLARHEVIVRFARIAASIGDGHTSLPLLFDPAVGFHSLPLRIGWYRDGLWVEAADAGLGQILGGRLTAVGGIPIEEALERVAPLISRDNDVWIRVVAPLLLARTEVLHALELTDDPTAALVTVEKDGVSRSLRIPALPSPSSLEHVPGGWRSPKTESWSDAGAAVVPLFLRHLDRTYHWTHLADADLVYFQLNAVQNAPHGPPLSEAFDQMLRFGEDQGVGNLVLDVRHNPGGEGSLNRPLVRELIRWTGRHPGSLFVIIGPRVFSAAQLLVQELETWTDATFVGGPTGSSPRFFGDHSFFRLPGSGLLVSAAPTWWQPGGPYDRRPFLPPDFAAEPVFEDYVEGRDPALEAILGWESRFTMEQAVAPLFLGDRAAAEEGLRRWASDPAHRYRDPALELNRLAYRTAREAGWEDALPLFRLNVAVHPGRANPWDSLGEALLALGERTEGLAAYRRAYELDPGVGRAATVLREHRSLPDS